MRTSRVSSKGRVTIPAEIRNIIGVRPGDTIAYEVHGRVVTLRRGEPFDGAFHGALGETLIEWGTPEDDEAFHDLPGGAAHPAEHGPDGEGGVRA